MLMDEGLDTGPVLLQRATEIGPSETAWQLEERLAALGAGLLLETLAGLEAETLAASTQDDSRASLAPLLKKADGEVDWTRPARVLTDRLRGFDPWPGATAQLGGRRLRLRRALALPGAGGAPGEILEVAAEGVRVACGEGSALLLLEVQPESRKPMPAPDWARGARIEAGQRFEAPPAAT
jgi:methionyl-tRNA formyltransferase